MNDTRKAKKGSKQHIHVFTRVRPLNEAEHAGSSFTVVQTPSNREVIVNDRSHEKYAKKFTFDRVFGPESKQIDVYNVVAKPLVEQVLAGYNCTVFAYGQTGTGKTFTMEGVTDDPSKHWETDNNAGLIPRAVAHLFDELCVLQVQEYVVRVSFLEIYNEELIDLLSSTYDTSKIRLYEDPNKKGSVIVHGLEEMIVRSKAEVYSILHKGSEKRQTAATLMNANSSRSHTVFSITVHIKENSVDGEEVLKLGKINLVDLAGSENVTRSGSSDKRAREAGNINQSLLTLGRVIIALVERAPHIPYRESKLTRLLQESLGGRMKTSIVATISPASVNLEETLSTLDYAHRAKNITNRPEINQKLFKKTLLLEYTEEIVRLKKDLQATRERIGVYLAQENYTQMQNLMQYQSKEMEAKVNRIKELQAEVEKTEQILDELRRKQAEQFAEVEKRNAELEAIVSAVNSKYSQIQTVKQEKIEQEYLLEKHSATEQVLVSQAEQLLTVVDTTVTDISRLRDKISRKKEIEQKNAEACHRFKNNFAENGEYVHVGVSEGIEDFKRFSESIENDIREQTHSYIDGTNEGIGYISKALVQSHEDGINVLYSTINSTHAHCQKWVEEQEKNLSNLTEKEQELLRAIAIKLAAQLQELMQSEVKIRLQTLTESVLKDYSVVMDFIMNAINSTLNYHSEDRERAINFFEEMKQMVDRVMGCERKTAEKHEAFAKMINNTINYFNNLHTESKECDFTACKNLENICGISDSAQERGESVHSFNIETDTDLRKRMIEDIGSARNHTLNELEKCQTLGDTRTTIMDKLQRDVAEFSESLQSNASSVQDSMRRFREKLEENSNTLTKSITDTREIVRNMAVDHSNIVQTHQTESLEKSENIISEFRKKCSDATNTTNEINGRLSILLDGVNRFFTEDLQHDVPTGCTPIKKNYSYPREFPALPPKGKGH